jgi:N-methylhydantoinase A
MLEVDRVNRFKPGSGRPIMVPTIDLIEIGAGGGSIAHINPLGLINVGPQSAGADPGPACYAQGGDQPTVTDANLLLGFLDPAYFLGGRMSLVPALAQQAIREHIARPLGIPAMEAAWGIYAIVNENMAQAARTHIIERNRDPRDLALVAFGGAGPAHAVPVAQALGIATVVVPLSAGVASAIGALTAPISLPFARSYMTSLTGCDWSVVERLFEDMEREALLSLRGSNQSALSVQFHKAVDLRFAGQYHELRVDLSPDIGAASACSQVEAHFRERYAEVYGRVPSGLQVEALNWHLAAELPRRTLSLVPRPLQRVDHRTALKGKREVFFAEPGSRPGTLRVPVYDRYRLQSGMTFNGPCIIEEREATVVVPSDSQVWIDDYCNVIVQGGNR